MAATSCTLLGSGTAQAAGSVSATNLTITANKQYLVVAASYTAAGVVDFDNWETFLELTPTQVLIQTGAKVGIELAYFMPNTSGAAQTVTLNFQAQFDDAVLAVYELDGLKITNSGADGWLGPVAATNTNANPTLTLAAFDNANNGAFFCVASDVATAIGSSFAPEASWSEKSDTGVGSLRVYAGYRVTNDTSPSCTSNAPATGWVAIGVEAAHQPIKAPISPGPPTGVANLVSNSLTLAWQPDTSDSAPSPTSYDVYLEEGVTPPTVLLGTTTGTYMNTGRLTGNGTYYWQVVASNADLATNGTVWTFDRTGSPRTRGRGRTRVSL